MRHGIAAQRIVVLGLLLAAASFGQGSEARGKSEHKIRTTTTFIPLQGIITWLIGIPDFTAAIHANANGGPGVSVGPVTEDKVFINFFFGTVTSKTYSDSVSEVEQGASAEAGATFTGEPTNAIGLTIGAATFGLVFGIKGTMDVRAAAQGSQYAGAVARASIQDPFTFSGFPHDIVFHIDQDLATGFAMIAGMGEVHRTIVARCSAPGLQSLYTIDLRVTAGAPAVDVTFSSAPSLGLDEGAIESLIQSSFAGGNGSFTLPGDLALFSLAIPGSAVVDPVTFYFDTDTRASSPRIGSGAMIPAIGTGSSLGWDPMNLDHSYLLTAPPGSSTLFMSDPITGIERIVIGGLTHSYIGDLQAILTDPTGTSYNVFLRPGLPPGVLCCGNSGNFVGGTYAFVPPGTSATGQLPVQGNALPGVFDQSSDTGAGVIWPEPDESTYNTPLDLIAGPPGFWTLSVYDWAGGDVGMFTSWALVPDNTLGTSYCPAALNSTGGPASIEAIGSSSVASNVLTLTATGLPMNSFGFFLTSRTQGNVPSPGSSQGILCLGGQIGRYVGPGQVKNSGGAGSFSLPLDLTVTPTPFGPVSVVAGEAWNFQAWYRDFVGFSTSNFTNGVRVVFAP